MGKKKKHKKSTRDAGLKKVEYTRAETVLVDNIAIAFVSDNDERMNQVFDLLRRRTEGIARKYCNENITCVDVPQKLPLCENLSQIINDWAAYGWDETVKVKKLYDKNTRKEIELGAVSYISRTVIVRNGNRCITYLHIKPEMILDLSPCIGTFSVVYVDLCSPLSLAFKMGKVRDRHDGFRCIPFISVMLSDLSTEDWFCLFRNYLEFPEVTGGIGCQLGYAEDTEKGSDSYDDITKTIVIRDSPINLPDIAILLLIDPISFLTGEDETEDNEDMEYFCRDEKEPSVPGQSSKDAIRMLVRIHSPEFEKIIDRLISETDVSGYETLEEYRKDVRVMAEDACWAYLDDLLERTGDQAADDSDVIREIIGALDSLVRNLIEYKFDNRLYETYKTKEQGDA
ncbi:MAG: hypothetical protein LUE65_03390 [Clostridiales bacterium]|nr:hypothetical protein [Clostridiales bacterium]